MKTPLLVVLMLLLFPAIGVHAGRTKDRNSIVAQAESGHWPHESVVSVYFVRDAFTAEEKQLLWDTIQAWRLRARNKGLEISFVPRGETGGLIDCVGCLTLARQALPTNEARQRVSFNALRRDQTGLLISAWIGFERAARSQKDLRSQMLLALDGRLVTNGRG